MKIISSIYICIVIITFFSFTGTYYLLNRMFGGRGLFGGRPMNLGQMYLLDQTGIMDFGF
jgi:hypothetical protein